MLEAEPLYFSVSVENRSDKPIEMRAVFTYWYGDVGLVRKVTSDPPEWRGIMLSADAGKICAERIKPYSLAPRARRAAIECLVPLAVVQAEEPTEMALRGWFHPKKKPTIFSTDESVQVIPAGRRRQELLEASLALINRGVDFKFEASEWDNIERAARKSDAIARVSKLCNEFHAIQGLIDNPDTEKERLHVAVESVAEQLSQFRSVEREYWACKFGMKHFKQASALSAKDPSRAKRHVDVALALHDAVGNSTEDAQHILTYAPRMLDRIQTRLNSGTGEQNAEVSAPTP